MSVIRFHNVKFPNNQKNIMGKRKYSEFIQPMQPVQYTGLVSFSSPIPVTHEKQWFIVAAMNS